MSEPPPENPTPRHRRRCRRRHRRACGRLAGPGASRGGACEKPPSRPSWRRCSTSSAARLPCSQGLRGRGARGPARARRGASWKPGAGAVCAPERGVQDHVGSGAPRSRARRRGRRGRGGARGGAGGGSGTHGPTLSAYVAIGDSRRQPLLRGRCRVLRSSTPRWTGSRSLTGKIGSGGGPEACAPTPSRAMRSQPSSTATLPAGGLRTRSSRGARRRYRTSVRGARCPRSGTTASAIGCRARTGCRPWSGCATDAAASSPGAGSARRAARARELVRRRHRQLAANASTHHRIAAAALRRPRACGPRAPRSSPPRNKGSSTFHP